MKVMRQLVQIRRELQQTPVEPTTSGGMHTVFPLNTESEFEAFVDKLKDENASSQIVSVH
jgi:hypothetical protein